MNCNYKVQMKDIQNKYKFKIFCTGSGADLNNYYTKNETNALLDAKYDKHTDGIPKADLSNDVQTSLGKADTALQQHQDISGKEDKTNKVTTISSTSTDTQYPSAKAVYTNDQELQTQLDEAKEQVERANMVYNALPKVNGSGEVITLDNTAETPLKMELSGNTSQETTSISGGDEYDSPSPDYPQDIEVVTGSNTIKVEGKNLFDKSKATQGYIKQDGTITTANVEWEISDYIKVIGGDNYTYQGLTDVGSSPYSAYYDKNKTFISSFKQATGNKTITIPNNACYVRFSIRISNSNVSLNDINTFMISKGTSATTYEPYQSQEYSVNLGSLELCKIGDYKDYIYKDNGSWYKHKEIGKVVLNGTETGWSGGTSATTSTDYTYVYCNTYDNVIKPRSFASFCDKFTSLNEIGMIISTSVDTDTIAVGDSSTSRIRIMILTSRLETQSTAGFKSWLSTHNTTVYYVLATPTNEPITDTTLINQLDLLEKAYAYQNQTNISQQNNDKPFVIDAETVYDLSNLVTRVAVLETE